ncbi:MAG: ISAs1 family transposase [Isosphaeraceae bacterium]|nr:ISAs1 family transposase [Isosphaeraceae bacterium]
MERRSIATTTWLEGYLARDWPGVRQVFRLRRERTIKGVKTVEEVYGITSLSRGKASASRLLSLVRSHWGIENQLFGVRDTTMGEDASRIRKGNAPEAMALLRNVALAALPKVKNRSRAGVMRHLCLHPKKALALLEKPGRQ